MALAAIGDERLASMIFGQQYQEKQSFNELLNAFSLSNAEAEFRRALKELIQEHLNTCVTNESNNRITTNSFGIPRQRLNHVSERCNICRLRELLHQDDEQQQEEHMMMRQHDNEDSTESSATRRRHTRTLNRWAARQAQEMLTTMERQAREAELMSLSGMHSVSTRDSSSFLRDPSPTRAVRSVERPSTRASSLVQMWRELEGGSRVGSRRDERRVRSSSRSASHTRRGSTDSCAFGAANEIANRAEVLNSNSVAQGANQVCAAEGNIIEANADQQHSRVDQSVNVREGEQERVSHIVQRWMTESRTVNAENSDLLEEQEDRSMVLPIDTLQERVRERSLPPSHGGTQVHHASETDEVQVAEAMAQENVQSRRRADSDRQFQVTRNPPRLRGRQALVDLLRRIERERQRELERLLEYRLVSHFSHRNRIQALLRGRFLRIQALPREQRSPSSAARELGQLRQRRTVTGLREGFPFSPESTPNIEAENLSEDGLNGQSSANENLEDLPPRSPEPSQEEIIGAIQPDGHGDTEYEEQEPRIENDVASQNGMPDESAQWQVVGHERESVWQAQEDEEEEERGAHDNNIEVIHQVWHESNTEASYPDWQENGSQGPLDWNNILDGVDIEWELGGSDVGGEWRQDASAEDGEWQDGSPQDINWPENSEQEMENGWQQRPQPVSSAWQRIHASQEFSNLEEPTSYNVELRELLNRRSVSTVLASEFRERMDRLILSYIRNRGRPPLAWNSGEQDQVEPNDVPMDVVDRPRLVAPPPPPPPPPEHFWRREIHRPIRTHTIHHSEVDWEVINDLRSDMTRLQEGMSDLHRMLETCMEMQLELQRSVRQEVSAALNRSNGGQGGLSDDSLDGNKWVTVRKGICCICCDKHIDSLLYRCGHMCTCLKCANELVHNSGKCPMCRAPIVEVVRAYCQV